MTQPIGCKQQPIGCSVEAVALATMIGCLPTQANEAIAFGWKLGPQAAAISRRR